MIDNAGPERFTVQYSVDGIHFKHAAKLDFIHTGCGPYAQDAFSNTTYGQGIRWGVAQHSDSDKKRLHIVRFDVDLTVPE